MAERVQLTIDNAVATVRMSRPEKRNALDPGMFEGLIKTGERIIADNSVRAVVLHGEGKAFCAGLDFASFLGSPDLMQKLLARGDKSPANIRATAVPRTMLGTSDQSSSSRSPAMMTMAMVHPVFCTVASTLRNNLMIYLMSELSIVTM